MARTQTFVSWPYNIFGHTQALLNAVMRDHNYLYYRLKRGAPSSSGWRDLANFGLLPFAATLGILFALVDAAVPSCQGVLTCCFEKRGSPP